MFCGFNPNNLGNTKGKIISSKKKDIGRSIDVQIVYEYTVEGKRYKSSRISCGSDGNYDSYLKYKIGNEVKVYFKKENPTLSVIEPSYSKNSMVLLLFFFLSSAIILYLKRKHIENEIEL